MLVPKEYKVTHEFQSGTPGYELPDEVRNLLPKTQTGKKDGDTVTPTEPEQKSVTTDEGMWNFVGYDRATDTINKADQKFVGTWELTPKEYKVTHEFKSGTAGYDLPSEVIALLPGDQTGKKDKEKVNPTAPAQTSVTIDGQGTWNFKGYDQDEKTIEKADQKFVGIWEFTPVTPPEKYLVTYEYVSGTPGKDLPAEIVAPTDPNEYQDGATVTIINPENNKVTVEDGTWEFIGYKPQDTTIKGAGINYVGTWEFTPKAYKVTHEFKSGTEGRELPDEVIALLPDNQTGKADGETVNPSDPKEGKTEVPTDDGKWVFTGYDEPEKTINKADQKFVGTWVFVPKEYKVSHKFVSITEGKVLPKEVTDLLPGNQTGKTNGETVNPSDSVEVGTKVKVDDGVWEFKGYDFQEKTIDKADVEFVGKWEFTPTYYEVTYEFESNTPGKELPEEVKALVPETETGKKNGDPVNPQEPSEKTVITKDGTWTFDGYDGEAGKINQADQHFKGTWTFEPATASSISGQVWIDNDKNGIRPDGETTVPKDLTAKLTDRAGNPVIDLDGNKVEDITIGTDGTYKFENLPQGEYIVTFMAPEGVVFTTKGAENSTEENNSDADPNTGRTDIITLGAGEDKVNYDAGVLPQEYKVTHEFKSGTPGKPLPPEFADRLPSDQPNKVNGDQVKPTQPTETTVEVSDGTWTFTGYDRQQATIDNGNEHFIGTWEFTSNATTGNVYVRYITEDGEILEEQSLVIKDAKVGSSYKTERKTFEDYEFVKMDPESAPAKGEVIGGNQYVIYVYKPSSTTPDPDQKTGNVYVKYITEDGKVLEEQSQVITNGEVGSLYTTEQKTFKGYEFVKMADGSAPAKGDVIAGDQYVTYVYKPTSTSTPDSKTGNVYVKYITEDGTVLEAESLVTSGRIGKAYKTELKAFDGYHFVKMGDGSADANGYVAAGDQHIVYVYKPDQVAETEYKVTHEFVSGTPGKELPQGVLDLTPGEETGKKDGETVTPTTPTGTTVEVEDGVWTFRGYDADSKAINKADQKFIGVWEFTPNEDPAQEAYKVTYEFVSGTPGKELPQGVIGLTPGEEIDKQNGTDVTPSTSVAVGTEVATEDGVWTFRGYDADSKTIDKADQKFIGVWEFTPKAATGNVYVKYVTDKGKVLKAESVVKKDAPVGEAYTTEMKTFRGYNFVRMDENSADANGNVIAGDLHVTYVYKAKKSSGGSSGSSSSGGSSDNTDNNKPGDNHKPDNNKPGDNHKPDNNKPGDNHKPDNNTGNNISGDKKDPHDKNGSTTGSSSKHPHKSGSKRIPKTGGGMAAPLVLFAAGGLVGLGGMRARKKKHEK